MVSQTRPPPRARTFVLPLAVNRGSYLAGWSSTGWLPGKLSRRVADVFSYYKGTEALYPTRFQKWRTSPNTERVLMPDDQKRSDQRLRSSRSYPSPLPHKTPPQCSFHSCNQYHILPLSRRDNCGQAQGFQLVALPSLILCKP